MPEAQGQPGQLLGCSDEGLVVACSQGAVVLRSLQMEGKTQMSAREFFRGISLDAVSFG